MSQSVSTRRLLANRGFVTLLAARTISMLGMAFSPVALAFGILQTPGATASTLSLVLACQTIPLVVFTLVGGVVADRYPRSWVLLSGEVFAAVAWASIGVMLLEGNPRVWLLCLAASLAGLGGAVVYPALNGIIPDLVPAEDRQPANTWLAMGASGSRLAGLVAGGAVVVLLGGGWAMVTAGAMYLVAAVLVASLPRTSSQLAGRTDSPIRQLIEGWGEFRSRQWLWVAVVQWSVMAMVLQAAIGVLGPLVAQTDLGGAAAWTRVLAGEAAGAVVGVGLSLVWHPRRPIRTAVIMTATGAIAPLLLGFSLPLWSVVGGAFLAGVGLELYGVWWMTTMQNEVAPEALSRVASYDAMGSLMLSPLGLLVAGPAAVLLGAHTALVVCGVVALATSVLALASPEVRGLRARQSGRDLDADAALEPEFVPAA